MRVWRPSAGAVVVAALLAAATPTPGRAAGGRTIPDGSWTGSMSFVAEIPIEGSVGAGNGVFGAEVACGAVNGPAAWDYIGESGSGNPQAANVSGRLGGSADAPLLFAEVISTPNMTIDNSDAPGLPLDITSSTCEMVEGTGEGQPPVEVDAIWTLVRDGSVDDPVAFAREAREITVAFADYEVAVTSGDFVPRADLYALVDRAIQLSASLRRSAECSPFGWSHRAIAADVVGRILVELLGVDSPTETGRLIDLIHAALGMGALGAGSSDPGAADLDAQVVPKLIELARAAASAGDTATLFEIGALAQQAGYTDVEAVVVAAIGGEL